MRPPSIQRVMVFGLLAVAAVGAIWLAYRWSEAYVLRDTASLGRAAVTLHVENIRGWLGRYRALPHIYAQDAHMKALLQDPTDPDLIATANRQLEVWNMATGAADTYVLDRQGTTIAASNWDQDATFVGKNYAFRPYYSQAMQGRLGRFFALGTQSGKRGYYFSHPVRDSNEIVGVMVVKAGVAAIEEELRVSPHEIYISGPEGVILLASHPDWRLKTLEPLDAETLDRIRTNRQFEIDRLKPVDFGPDRRHPSGERLVVARPDRSDSEPREFLHLSQPMTVEGWTLHLLMDLRGARTQILTAVLLAASLLLAAALVGTLVWQRRRRLVERLSEREQAQITLERTVNERTADLRTANLLLEAEVVERKAAEEELRRTQTELIQAGKLAALGQMAAALSHEFNQPLTAIRTYADNAIAFLERGREDEAQTNIRRISKLTERMAELSKHLSTFARKPKDTVGAVSLTGALLETLELLRGRLEKAGIRPRIDAPDDAWVLGGHVRLQHVIMNLITNALDAVREQDQPDLWIAVQAGPNETRLVVEDNGQGIAHENLEKIFDPFFTTKEVGQGLGLGLSISFNIVKDFGGTLRAENRDKGGARFTVALRTAAPAEEAAE